MNVKKLPIGVGITLVIASILYIVANAVNNWSEYSILSVSSTIGLWQTCISASGTGTCVKIDCPSSSTTVSTSSSSSSSTSYSSNVCSKFMAARAFITLVCIALPIVAAMILLWAFFHENIPKVVLVIMKVVVSVCVGFGVIGVAIGIATTLRPYDDSSSSSSTTSITYTISAGAIIGIIAIVLNFGGAIAAAKID